jgi:hypothetical protein
MSINKLHPEYIIDAEGEKKYVVLPVGEYEALLEDLADLALLVERHDEPSVPHRAVIDELKRDGLLAD